MREAGYADRRERDNSDMMSVVISEAFLSLPKAIQSFRHVADYSFNTVRKVFDQRLAHRMEHLDLFSNSAMRQDCQRIFDSLNYVLQTDVDSPRLRFHQMHQFQLK